MEMKKQRWEEKSGREKSRREKEKELEGNRYRCAECYEYQ